MALDTIPTPIPHRLVHEIISKLDERGETYEFIVANATRGFKTPPLELTLHREGDTDPLVLRLDMNGTWSAEYVIVIGEKR